jgi:dienelactone hydrolase
MTALLIASSIAYSQPCIAEQQSASPAEAIQIPLNPSPFILQGLLRRPADAGRSPAVILLAVCNGYGRPLDEDWGARVSSWGYVTLTIDSFGPRGIKNCEGRPTPDLSVIPDAYRGLNFLAQKSFVDPKRVALVGFGWGAWQTLSAIESGGIEQTSTNKFRAAAAFYPFCSSSTGIMTVPILILIGERDEWAPADACRKMAAGDDDMGIARRKGRGAEVRLIVYPDARHGFDVRPLQTPIENRGRQFEFNQIAADQSSEALHEFLNSTVGGRQ